MNSSTAGGDERWAFLRDVLVFQLKMLVDNARDFTLIPVSLVAAIIDLFFKGEREGALFYRVLAWGAESEKIIDVYSPLERRAAANALPLTEHEGAGASRSEYTIDAVVARLERVVVREYEKGGTAASIKAAMDRTLDQLHKETRPATELVTRAAETVRKTIRPPNE